MNTKNQLHFTVSSVGIWDSFSNCLLMCAVLTCTLPLQSLQNSTSLESHTATCSLHGNTGSEWKGKEGRKGASTWCWEELKAGQDECLGSPITTSISHWLWNLKQENLLPAYGIINKGKKRPTDQNPDLVQY